MTWVGSNNKINNKTNESKRKLKQLPETCKKPTRMGTEGSANELGDGE